MGTGGLQTKLFFLETLYWTDLYHLQGLHTSSSSALWLLVLITHPEKKKKKTHPVMVLYLVRQSGPRPCYQVGRVWKGVLFLHGHIFLTEGSESKWVSLCLKFKQPGVQISG